MLYALKDMVNNNIEKIKETLYFQWKTEFLFKYFLFFPILFCLKKTGPSLVHFIMAHIGR